MIVGCPLCSSPLELALSSSFCLLSCLLSSFLFVLSSLLFLLSSSSSSSSSSFSSFFFLGLLLDFGERTGPPFDRSWLGLA